MQCSLQMMVEDVDAQELAITARESLSSYCYTECRAYCCRQGYLLLDKEEVKLLQGDKKELKMIPVEMAMDQKGFVFDLGSKREGCPRLLDYKCSIHKNPARPKACKEFPLFIWKDKVVMVANKCPAVKENKLYPYLVEFKNMGYKIVYAGKEY